MTMMLGPGAVREPEAGNVNGTETASDAEPARTTASGRPAPQSRPAGSADPAEIEPDRI